MKNKLILGGGVAGLLTAFYNPDYKIIDFNPLGQLSARFNLGPRVFKEDDYVRSFLNKLNINFYSDTIKVGYTSNGVDDIPLTEEFKRLYSMITRGTHKFESSFLSSGQDCFKYFTDGDDYFYTKVFSKLLNKVVDRVIYESIISIDLKNKIVKTDRNEYEYSDCISTINLNKFCDYAGIEGINFGMKNKHFAICSYDNNIDLLLRLKFNYMYSSSGWYTRKTYYSDYVVYELVSDFGRNIKYIEGNKIYETFFNKKMQILKNVDIQDIAGVKMVGRYAQWNHSIKSNEIIRLYEREQQ